VRLLEVAPFVSPIDERREQLGGAQAILADLARGLAERGHEVYLAAAKGSHVAGTITIPLDIDASAFAPASFSVRGGRPDDEAQREAFTRVRRWLDDHAEIEVVHAHAYDAPAFAALEGARAGVFHTLHLPPLDPAVVDAVRRAEDARHVTVSRANADAWGSAGVAIHAIVPNGIALERVAFGAEMGAYLVCAGRIAPEKGTDVAIRAASAAGLPLAIVGGVYDQIYHERCVGPHVRREESWSPPTEGAVYYGPQPRQALHKILAGAAATLMPVRWDEPFGIVALESLAAGTPVVAFARGGLAELIDASCGMMVTPDDEDEFAGAIPRARRIDRRACRARAERFSLPAMLDAYEGMLSK
jgi:glycosyltransferase involved in cell wall biosynthesis